MVMQNIGRFRYLQPSFYAGLLDDPVMLINIRPTGRGFLFDCGQLHHLAKRVLRSVDAVFVSHAHMDHLMGFDHLLRHVLVAPRTIAVYGPHGIAERIGSKLAGYDWNLVEPTWCTIEVHEVNPGTIEQYQFAGSRGFKAQHSGSRERRDRTLLRTRHLIVEAEICDHKLPVLIFRATEREPFLIDKDKLRQERLLPGPWLRELAKRFHKGSWSESPLEIWREEEGQCKVDSIADPEGFYQRIRLSSAPASIGYISDTGMTPDNLARIRDLMHGVTLLVSECTFLAADQTKARISSHLCTTDLNVFIREVRPAMLLPMHLSKSYLGDTQRLYAELDPAPDTRILCLPDYLTPRPLLPSELPQLPLLP
jgi:ribonuclease Z